MILLMMGTIKSYAITEGTILSYTDNIGDQWNEIVDAYKCYVTIDIAVFLWYSSVYKLRTDCYPMFIYVLFLAREMKGRKKRHTVCGCSSNRSSSPFL